MIWRHPVVARWEDERRIGEAAEATVALSHPEGCECSVCKRVKARIKEVADGSKHD